MKKRFAFGAIFLSIYLAFVLVSVPATFVLSFVKLPKNVSLSGVKGTIWQMSVEEIIHPQVTLTNVQAQLSFWSLLKANPSIDLSFGDAFSRGPSGKLTVAGLFADISLFDAEVMLSARDIIPYLPLPIALDASGDINVTIKEFVVGQPICQQAIGSMSWRKASISALNETVQLGDLAAILSCEQGALAVTLDQKNNLGVSFVAYFRTKGVSGNGYLKPAENFPEKLKAALPFLGKTDNQGRYRLSF